jgi:hypothetical protein
MTSTRAVFLIVADPAREAQTSIDPVCCSDSKAAEHHQSHAELSHLKVFHHVAARQQCQARAEHSQRTSRAMLSKTQAEA